MVSLQVLIIATLAWTAAVQEKAAARTIRATCLLRRNRVLTGADDDVHGTITFRQRSGGSTTIKVDIEGFSTRDANFEHGFHIHESDDMSDGCNSLGGHYNPLNVVHSGPTSAIRHVGDLGNVQEDSDGTVHTTITANRIELSGVFSVIGRSVIVHQMRDDLGLGGDPESLVTGNAGSRLGCCIINAATKGQISTFLMTSCIALFLKVYL